MEGETGRKEWAQKDIYFLMGKMKEILDICINLGIMDYMVINYHVIPINSDKSA
jgi:hypothetical protein